MNAIIFRLFTVNGALFDVLDYYLFAKSIGKDTKLILIRTKKYMTPKQLFRHVINRYDNLPDGWWENIIWLKGYWQLVSMKFKNIVVMDYFTTEILKYTNVDKYHLVYDHDKNYIEYYKSCIKDKRFIVYNEMPFGIGIDYKLKLPIELYKIPKKSASACYIHCSGGKSISELKRARELTDKKLLILSYFPDNFFELWDTYMYIHDGKYFEPRCRLLLEAKMMQKKIIYNNMYEIKDGSFYRWMEIQNLKKLPKQRILTAKDKLIKIL